MNNYSFRDKDGRDWVRVNKTTARKVYDKGFTIGLCAHKVNPCGSLGFIQTNKKRCEGRDFETLINEFSFYNCNLNETGKYPAFYYSGLIEEA